MLIIVRGRMRVCRHRLSVSEFTFAQLRSIECFTHVRKMCDDKRESFLFFFTAKFHQIFNAEQRHVKYKSMGQRNGRVRFKRLAQGRVLFERRRLNWYKYYVCIRRNSQKCCWER